MTAPLDLAGPAAPPRDNGELVFAQPWESRAFGMAVTNSPHHRRLAPAALRSPAGLRVTKAG